MLMLPACNMNKKLVMIGMVILLITIILCGCNDSGNNGSTDEVYHKQ